MTGDYVTFLDSDDILYTNAIEKTVDAILSNNVDCVIYKRAICTTTKN